MGLIDWFESLPDWCFVSVDNAYPLMQKMLVPHNSTELWSDSHIAFNFYLSQFRIRIEMAFVRLTTKWRRLWTTMNFAPAKNAKIIRVCAKLHNYVMLYQVIYLVLYCWFLGGKGTPGMFDPVL